MTLLSDYSTTYVMAVTLLHTQIYNQATVSNSLNIEICVVGTIGLASDGASQSVLPCPRKLHIDTNLQKPSQPFLAGCGQSTLE